MTGHGKWGKCSLGKYSNYVSSGHMENDAFLSCMTVSNVHQKYNTDDDSTTIYNEHDMLVEVFFCVPEYNAAFRLRPGEVMFFNPLHCHCESQQTEDYKKLRYILHHFTWKLGM